MRVWYRLPSLISLFPLKAVPKFILLKTWRISGIDILFDLPFRANGWRFCWGFIAGEAAFPLLPVPGRGGDDVRVDVRIPEIKDRIPVPEIPRRSDEEPTKRRVRINRSDVMKYGMTPNCSGCTAINRGQSHQPRTRIEEELRKEGCERQQS